ncbi:mitochondrial fission ELM1 family protein [Frateuria sp. STR12]|uniref:mitochondrial fission ELM1 family protein n=1 Tax=Frateuria hangzhouensis TaxID=2995589 RepID=UPI002260E9FC|nr:mitochondrial fission ELM1 family protein [Frateuria sp. STR12]MCX7514458.1 mitochondrial fission ELM1 family protein [Frateuria sp. STR12]
MSALREECWAIADEAAGNQRQALALAERLGLPVRPLVLVPRAPWSWLAPRLTLGGELALPPADRAGFVPPWPRVAVGCGRAAALFTRVLRRLSHGRCHTVQILDPRIDPRHWDTVVAPRHDGLAGANVLTPLGSLNPVDEAWLADARDAWPQLAELPAPRIGVLLGGPRHGIALDEAWARGFADGLHALQRRHDGSLLVLASRRTPAPLAALLREATHGIAGLHWHGPADGLNPYPGVLAWADGLVVTPDSVNMLSEACAVGCAVRTFAPVPLPDKLARFHRVLREGGLLHDLEADAPARQPPLRETERIASTVRHRLAHR